MLNFIQNYWKACVVFMSFSMFVYSLFKSLINSIALKKIRDNHLAHMEKDLKNLEKDDEKMKKQLENIKDDILKEIHKIHLTTRRIEHKVIKRDAVCETRHSQNDK